jgi:hypothetical protein
VELKNVFVVVSWMHVGVAGTRGRAAPTRIESDCRLMLAVSLAVQGRMLSAAS